MTKPNLALHDRIKPYIIPVTESGCLLWEGASSRGYGVLNVKKKLQYVHRLMWELRNGPIQDGLCALHKCDVPSCVNPDHLFLGSPRENSRDMAKKKRSTIGARNPSAKMTEDQVIKIRIDGRTANEIARSFGISIKQVANIKSGFSWRYLI